MMGKLLWREALKKRIAGGLVTERRESMVFICKLAGIVFVMGAAGYLSLSMGQNLDRRKCELRGLYSIFIQLKSQIQYMGDTLPECFETLSKGAKGILADWLVGLAERLNLKQDMVFSEIWSEELNRLYQISALVKEDVEPLRELGDKLGSADVDAQIKAIDYALLHMEKNRQTLEETMEQKKKVIVTLSLFGGFMTLLILF